MAKFRKPPRGKRPLGAVKGAAGKRRALAKRNPRASGRGFKGLKRPIATSRRR